MGTLDNIIKTDEELLAFIMNNVEEFTKSEFRIELQSHYNRLFIDYAQKDMFAKNSTYQKAKSNNEVYVNDKKIAVFYKENNLDKSIIGLFFLNKINFIEEHIKILITDLPVCEKKVLLELNKEELSNFFWQKYPYNLPTHSFYNDKRNAGVNNHELQCSSLYYLMNNFLNDKIDQFNLPLKEKIMNLELPNFPQEKEKNLFKRECLFDIFRLTMDFYNFDLKPTIENTYTIWELNKNPSPNIELEKIKLQSLDSRLRIWIEQNLLNYKNSNMKTKKIL